MFNRSTEMAIIAMSRLAEVREMFNAFHEGDEVEVLDAEQVQSRLEQGSIYVLDVRPEPEYRDGHLPGAASLPLPQLQERLGELPTDRDVVAYCRGPFCIMADEAVRAMRAKGINASRMEEGPLEWREQGIELESQQTD